jgi:hypothetical protein
VSREIVGIQEVGKNSVWRCDLEERCLEVMKTELKGLQWVFFVCLEEDCWYAADFSL